MPTVVNMAVIENEVVISARIPLIHNAVLGHLAKQRGASRSDLVRAAIADWIARNAEGNPDQAEPEMTLVEQAILNELLEANERRSRETERLYKIFKRIQEAIDDADYYVKELDS
jgi:hypothetical protein